MDKIRQKALYIITMISAALMLVAYALAMVWMKLYSLPVAIVALIVLGGGHVWVRKMKPSKKSMAQKIFEFSGTKNDL